MSNSSVELPLIVVDVVGSVAFNEFFVLYGLAVHACVCKLRVAVIFFVKFPRKPKKRKRPFKWKASRA